MEHAKSQTHRRLAANKETVDQLWKRKAYKNQLKIADISINFSQKMLRMKINWRRRQKRKVYLKSNKLRLLMLLLKTMNWINRKRKLEKQSPGGFLQKRYSQKFRKIHSKTTVLESLFQYKVAGLKRRSETVEELINFKKNEKKRVTKEVTCVLVFICKKKEPDLLLFIQVI